MMDVFPHLKDAWFLSGPTASGKTRLGILLAQRIGAEILSLDSMAVYKRLDIGTAKPSPEEQRQCPHHLIDLVEPSEDFSLAEYLSAAHEKAAEIRARGRRVLFVGGTPLYLKSLLRGLSQGPPPDWELRSRLEEQAKSQGPNFLRQQVAEVDPPTAERLHANDTRRLIRALEFHAATGTRISDWQSQFATPRPEQIGRAFALRWEREPLYERIDRRVDVMFAEGWVDEVRSLLDQGIRLGRTASQAVGYEEILGYLENRGDLDAAVALTKFRTHNLARKQETWFRSLEEVESIGIDQSVSLESLADTLAGKVDQLEGEISRES